MAPLPATDTIAAIATAPGMAGIGIIRISGPESFAILERIFLPRKPRSRFESHKLYYGNAMATDGRILDEVLAVRMEAPRTYTREDMVELHGHGSSLLLQDMLRAVFEAGARPAENGEFTKRAFLNGRIDLTQAEAVLELLQARTAEGAGLALHQMKGELFHILEQIRQRLITLLAQVEVAIDFPDEDVEILDRGLIHSMLREEVIARLEGLIAMAAKGRLIREGLTVVIAGRPNAGKSSLLNALLLEERALVTAIAGTTRDTIEETIVIRGIPVTLVDTAGIREHRDPVEALGIERARQKLQAADLVLFLMDASDRPHAEDDALYESIRHQPHCIVLNKRDIAPPEALAAICRSFPEDKVIAISALQRQGLDLLEEAIYESALGGDAPGPFPAVLPCAPNTRHLPVLKKTLAACQGFAKALLSGAPVDLLAVDLQTALTGLGEITGASSPDEILDAVFNQFCLGK